MIRWLPGKPWADESARVPLSTDAGRVHGLDRSEVASLTKVLYTDEEFPITDSAWDFDPSTVLRVVRVSNHGGGAGAALDRPVECVRDRFPDVLPKGAG